MKKLVSILLCCLFTFGLIGCGNGQLSSGQKSDNNSKKVSKDAYEPSDEEKKVLSKHYEDLTGSELEILDSLEKKSNLFTDSDNANIKYDLERLKKERDAYFEKSVQQSNDNKQLYDDFKKEIESEYPNMKFDTIIGTDKKKNLMIDTKLLDNLDMTKAKCKELALKKETEMKDMGISTIVFTVKNKNDELQGSYMLDLKNGKYKVSVDAL